MYADRAAARAHELAKELEAVRGDCIEWSRRALQAEAELDRIRQPVVPSRPDVTRQMTLPRLRSVPRHDGSH
jgi:hypothetical protein